jgi:transposase
VRAGVFDFARSGADEHARAYLQRDDGVAWQCQLVCDDYAGYKASFT